MLSFFFSSKLVTLSFVLRQMFVEGLFIEARPRVLREIHYSFGWPMLSVNFALKNQFSFV